METKLIPNEVTIPPYDFSNSKLKLKALEIATPEVHTLNLNVGLIFSDTPYFIPTNSPINANTLPQIKNKTLPLTITVLPSLGFDEDLNNFYNAWLAPVSEMWTFLAGIAAAVSPLIIRKYSKEKKKNSNVKTE